MTTPEKTGEIRDDKGKFVPGVSGNPEGRPKGAGISITTAIKRELEKIPEGQKATYLDLLVKKILKKGIVEGDNHTIKNIWNYVDGMPTQKNEITGKDGADLIPKPLLANVQNNNSTPEDNGDEPKG